MKISLLHPAGYNWMPGKNDISAIANRMAPLGLLSIGAYLEKKGHEIDVVDCLGPYAPSDKDVLVDRILESHPKMVGVSCTTSGFLDGYDIACRLKERDASLITVFGGVHISALGKVILESYKAIDYLCMGEGEQTMADLAAGRAPSDTLGIVWRNGSKIISNPERPVIENLDDLPFPAYHTLKGFPTRYNLPLFSYIDAPGATMVTSRGCPYQCSYCDRSVFKRSFRYNTAGYIYEHMNYLRKEFGVRHINIYDDLFTLNRPRIQELCNMLIRKPLGLRFNCAVRVGHADRELCTLLKNAGCLMVSLGIESSDPSMLKRHKAGVTNEKVRETVVCISSSGLRVKGLFMMGLPGETEESIIATSDFCLSLGLDDMNMSKFTPFPGAPIWKSIQDEGDFTEDWKKMNCLNFVFLPKTISSMERLNYLYNWHVKRFYSDRAWRKKFGKRIWEHRLSLWHMLKHMRAFSRARKDFEPV